MTSATIPRSFTHRVASYNAATERAALREFRAAVPLWLAAEGASVEHAMGLLLFLLAGMIEGGEYLGRRFSDCDLPSPSRDVSGSALDAAPDAVVAEWYTLQDNCGCLLDTLERRGKLGRAKIVEGTPTATVFGGALNIHLGDTPERNPWARAAYKGIEAYISTIEGR